MEFEEDGKYFGPLYLKIFYINNPSLMFAGLLGNNVYNIMAMEKGIIFMKHYICGQVQLPSQEEMLQNLEKERQEVAERCGLQNFFRIPLDMTEEYFEKMRKILLESDVGDPEKLGRNEKYLESLGKMMDVFDETLGKYNFRSFKKYDYLSLVEGDEIFDTTEYF